MPLVEGRCFVVVHICSGEPVRAIVGEPEAECIPGLGVRNNVVLEVDRNFVVGCMGSLTCEA